MFGPWVLQEVDDTAMNMYVVLGVVLCFVCPQVDTSMQYKVAAFEHIPYYVHDGTIPSREKALGLMRVNIAVFKNQAMLAAKRGAHIIVFPEDGIHGLFFKRDEIQPYLEPIPEITNKTWVPCTDPLPNTEILQELSCIALNYSIAVVANMGDIKYCSQTTDPHCPHDGRYQYNTDVVFDSDGKFLAKYHKQHLYDEAQYNTPLVCEFVTFVPSFGVRFGIFTCFDMIFKSPAVDLVDKYGVENLIVPTAWYRGFPVMKSIQYFQGWSRTHCVNLIVANLFVPILDFTGSGIYQCGGVKAYTCNDESIEKRLLITTLLEKVHPRKTVPFQRNMKCKDWNKVENNIETTLTSEDASCASSSHRKTFEVRISRSLFTLTKLDKKEDQITVCAQGMCCHLHYKISDHSSLSESFAFGLSRGYHPVYNYFKEICVVFKCATNQDESCGIEIGHSETIFQSFEMTGNFSQNATIYPGILSSGCKLSQPDVVKFHGYDTIASDNFDQPLLTAALVSRVYWKDKLD